MSNTPYLCALLFLTDNPVLTSKVTVTIHVLDVNEFPPELAVPYETYVCEGAKVGQVSVDENMWMNFYFFEKCTHEQSFKSRTEGEHNKVL